MPVSQSRKSSAEIAHPRGAWKKITISIVNEGSICCFYPTAPCPGSAPARTGAKAPTPAKRWTAGWTPSSWPWEGCESSRYIRTIFWRIWNIKMWRRVVKLDSVFPDEAGGSTRQPLPRPRPPPPRQGRDQGLRERDRGGGESDKKTVLLFCVPIDFPISMYLTCGRRPAGLLATLVVVVVGGGELLYMGTGRTHVWFRKNKARSYIFVVFYIFYFKSPFMV